MTYRHSFNPPITYGSEWEHFVDDEARSRGIPSNDQQALEDLEDELRTKCERSNTRTSNYKQPRIWGLL